MERRGSGLIDADSHRAASTSAVRVGRLKRRKNGGRAECGWEGGADIDFVELTAAAASPISCVPFNCRVDLIEKLLLCATRGQVCAAEPITADEEKKRSIKSDPVDFILEKNLNFFGTL